VTVGLVKSEEATGDEIDEEIDIEDCETDKPGVGMADSTIDVTGSATGGGGTATTGASS